VKKLEKPELRKNMREKKKIRHLHAIYCGDFENTRYLFQNRCLTDYSLLNKDDFNIPIFMGRERERERETKEYCCLGAY
jgi:hypothetical protein